MSRRHTPSLATERVQVFFRTERDAYVTVLRVDTDGRVRVLFPPAPGDPNLARGGETYTVPGVDDSAAFIVDDPPGLGYVFAMASQDPVAYDAFTADGEWSLQSVPRLSDGRIHGDPNASLQELVRQIMPDGYADYDTQLLAYDVDLQRDNSSIALAAPSARQPPRTAAGTGELPYDVAQQNDRSSEAFAAPLAAGQPAHGAFGARQLPYDVAQRHYYPRFLCYDCHAYVPYASWNPYSAWCPQYSLAVYDSPFYSYSTYGYPARYYGGTNVVYARSGSSGRQYVFRTRVDQAAPYAVYRNRAGGGMRPTPGHGVRGVDVGGVGSVPAPGGRRTIGGGVEHGLGGVAVQRPFITGMRQETGRLMAGDAAPWRTAPSREYIAPRQSRQRGMYINPGARQTGTPSPSANGRPEARGEQRYIPQAASRQEWRGAPGYGASQSPRSGYAPRGGGSGPSSRAPAQGRRGLVYVDPGTPPRSAPWRTGIGRPDQRENQRYYPQSSPRQGSRGAPGYGESHGTGGMRGCGAARGPRSGYEPRGGGRASSSRAAREPGSARSHERRR